MGVGVGVGVGSGVGHLLTRARAALHSRLPPKKRTLQSHLAADATNFHTT